LLALAVTHRSWCAEHDGYESNERLEFLGDAVLGLVVTDHIFESYPNLDEGALAKVRAAVVSSATLSVIAKDLDLGAALLLGKGEEITGGRQKASIIADAMEAVIGSVYLDGGWDAARELILGLLRSRIEEASEGPGGQDYKTRLQELAARTFEQLPRYEITHDGPDHAKEFFAQVYLSGDCRGTGRGRSKKQAQQDAAKAAWNWMVAERQATDPLGEGRPPDAGSDEIPQQDRMSDHG